MSKDKTSVTLDPEVLAWLKERARELDRSVSWIINEMGKERMEKEKNG